MVFLGLWIGLLMAWVETGRLEDAGAAAGLPAVVAVFGKLLGSVTRRPLLRWLDVLLISLGGLAAAGVVLALR